MSAKLSVDRRYFLKAEQIRKTDSLGADSQFKDSREQLTDDSSCLTAHDSHMRQAFWLAITFLAIENAVLVNLFITKHIVLTSTLSEGSDLLLVAVDKQSPAKPGKFEIDFEQSAANDQWIENPIAVAHRAFGTTAPVNLWLIQGKGDDSNELFVTAISDRFSDDSVRGKRSELILKRGHDGHWHIDSALESHRCWPGRGHQSFGIEPCS